MTISWPFLSLSLIRYNLELLNLGVESDIRYYDHKILEKGRDWMGANPDLLPPGLGSFHPPSSVDSNSFRIQSDKRSKTVRRGGACGMLWNAWPAWFFFKHCATQKEQACNSSLATAISWQLVLSRRTILMPFYRNYIYFMMITEHSTYVIRCDLIYACIFLLVRHQFSSRRRPPPTWLYWSCNWTLNTQKSTDL